MESETVATGRYLHSVASQYPKTNHFYKVDSSIQSRINRDYLPVNANLNSTQVNESYFEFILNASDKEFFHFGKFMLELQVKIVNEDGSDLAEDDSVVMCDGFGHALISQVQMFCNDISVETNNYFGIWNVVKTYLTMDQEEYLTWGSLNYYRNILQDTVNDAYFQKASEQTNLAKCKNTLHMMVPIDIDLASADKYLLDNVSVRIRFDLNPASVVLMSHTGQFNYKISLAKLHVEKIIPNPSSLVALNKAMRMGNEFVEYIIDRPIIKTNVFPRGYTSITVDNMFNGIIPSKLITFVIAQEALGGAFSRNPVYFNHCNINSIRLEMDGHLHTSLSGDFEMKYAQFFINTLVNNGGSKTLITPESFVKGKSIFVFDLRNSDRSDCLNIEKKGNLRLSLGLSSALTENYVLFSVGISHGSLNISADRIVRTSFLL